MAVAGNQFNICFTRIPLNATPVVVRNMVLEQALVDSDIVVLVDADDMLFETRVEAARKSAEKNDVTAAAMGYMDENGNRMDGFFDPYAGDKRLIKNNVFGFSNTTWRSRLLQNVLPVSENCVLMDWYVTTLALYSGATLGIDPEPRMLYRQHPGNIAVFRPPFRSEQIIKTANLVLGHYDLILNAFTEKGIKGGGKFREAENYVSQFAEAIKDQNLLEKYANALNYLPNKHVWWSCVAHPDLEEIWV
ncbi:MAG: hypothetical protein K9N10_22985 [Deltaproteobacteria bacterium]|nr:hypothetical protein [Deltaproteobacteria bacterium]